MTVRQPTARTVGFRPGERNVFFHILTPCNLSCRHCYINPAQHGTATLSAATVIDWLRLFTRPERQSNLVLLGGEPTLHPDLPAIIRAAKSLRFAVTVDTNGYLFHNFLNRITPKELDYLSFSLDGPNAAVNDPIRGENSFAVCTGNLKKAVRKGFHTSVIYTVSSLNIDHLHRMPPLLKTWGVDRFFIQVIGLRGKPAAEKAGEEIDWQVNPDHWLRAVPPVAAEAAALGLHVTYPRVFLAPDEVFECAGNVAENYFIFPNGRVYRCPLCEDFPIHAYQIEDNRLVRHEGVNEDRFFPLTIPEGCVMNKLLQPDKIDYLANGTPRHRISCCLLKEEIIPEDAGGKNER